MVKRNRTTNFKLKSKCSYISFVTGVTPVLLQARNYLQTAAPPTHWTLAGKCSHSTIFRFRSAIWVYLLCWKHRWLGECWFFPPCSMPGEVLLLEGAKQSWSCCTNGFVIAVLGWRCLHWSRRRGRWMGSSKDSSQTPRSTGADWSCEYNSACSYEMRTELPKPKPTSHPFVLEEILREQNSNTC